MQTVANSRKRAGTPIVDEREFKRPAILQTAPVNLAQTNWSVLRHEHLRKEQEVAKAKQDRLEIISRRKHCLSHAEINSHVCLDFGDEKEPVTQVMRAAVREWMSEVATDFALNEQTLHIAWNCLDRLVAKQSIRGAATPTVLSPMKRTLAEEKQQQPATPHASPISPPASPFTPAKTDYRDGYASDSSSSSTSPSSITSTPSSATSSPESSTSDGGWVSSDDEEDDGVMARRRHRKGRKPKPLPWVIQLALYDPNHRVPRHPLSPTNQSIRSGNYQLAAMACLMIAQKYEEIYPSTSVDMVCTCDGAFDGFQLKAMELFVLNELKFLVQTPTVNEWAQLYIKEMCEIQDTPFKSRECQIVMAVIDIAMINDSLSRYLPSTIAAAALFVGWFSFKRAEEDKEEDQFPLFKSITGYDPNNLIPCIFYLQYIYTKREEWFKAHPDHKPRFVPMPRYLSIRNSVDFWMLNYFQDCGAEIRSGITDTMHHEINGLKTREDYFRLYDQYFCTLQMPPSTD